LLEPTTTMKTLIICLIVALVIGFAITFYWLRNEEKNRKNLINKLIGDLNDELEKNPDIMSVSTTDSSITLHPKVDRITAFAILESKLALYGLRLEEVKEEQDVTVFTANGPDGNFYGKIHWSHFSCTLTIR
jgi:hypothetical protein